MNKKAFGITLIIVLLAVPLWAAGEDARPGRADSTQVKARADETLVWNEVMLEAILASTLGNPQTIRMAATVNSAMFDAQNGIGHQDYSPIFVKDRAPSGTHRSAALVQAAYVTLKSFYPEQLSRFDAQRALSLVAFDGDDSVEVQRGIEWGEHVANKMLAWRATDGFSDPVPSFTGAGAILGQWESVTGTSMAAGNLSFTAPFVLTSSAQFQSALPRPWTTLASAEYAEDFNEVATIGVKTNSIRTLDQTHIAFFFNGYATNDYVEAAIQIARKHKSSPRDNSRIFALLTIAMHDTSVTMFRAKRDFGVNSAELTWRPIFAIQNAAPRWQPGHRPDCRLDSADHDTESPRVPSLASGITRSRLSRAAALLRRPQHIRDTPRVQHSLRGTRGGWSRAAALFAHFRHGAGRHRRAYLWRDAFPQLEQCVGKVRRQDRRLCARERCPAHEPTSLILFGSGCQWVHINQELRSWRAQRDCGHFAGTGVARSCSSQDRLVPTLPMCCNSISANTGTVAVRAQSRCNSEANTVHVMGTAPACTIR